MSSIMCPITTPTSIHTTRCDSHHTPLPTFAPSYPTVDTNIHIQTKTPCEFHTIQPPICPDLSFFSDKQMTHCFFYRFSSPQRSLFVQCGQQTARNGLFSSDQATENRTWISFLRQKILAFNHVRKCSLGPYTRSNCDLVGNKMIILQWFKVLFLLSGALPKSRKKIYRGWGNW